MWWVVGECNPLETNTTQRVYCIYFYFFYKSTSILAAVAGKTSFILCRIPLSALIFWLSCCELQLSTVMMVGHLLFTSSIQKTFCILFTEWKGNWMKGGADKCQSPSYNCIAPCILWKYKVFWVDKVESEQPTIIPLWEVELNIKTEIQYEYS